jgi:hypothetical protein
VIAVESSQGRRLRNLGLAEGVYAYHKRFGFVPEAELTERAARRYRHGLKADITSETVCRFTLHPAGEGFKVQALEGCEAVETADSTWSLKTAAGHFALQPVARAQSLALVGAGADEDEKSGLGKYALIALLLISLPIALLSTHTPTEKAPEVLPPPVQVTVVPEVQKAVKVPEVAPSALEINDPRLQSRQTQRAIKQQLGFLGVLGKKNLSKAAIGGVPTALPGQDASPGAGPGGKGGSGGEFLVGLGQGVRRATVGNTGVAGLGGVRTKAGGAGGGQGGYGNTLIGSGEGRALSTVVGSGAQDMVLEGGLDRAVIQATIAKYLSQVRACYEAQLQSNPGLAGQVTMKFAIDGGGDVASAAVERSTLGNAQVEGCIAQRLKTWKFPKPVGGVTVKVNYPFLLRPVGT